MENTGVDTDTIRNIQFFKETIQNTGFQERKSQQLEESGCKKRRNNIIEELKKCGDKEA